MTARKRDEGTQAIQFWSKLVGALFIVLMVTVWEHVQALDLEKELKTLRRDVDRMTYENGRMDSQINQWESAGRLDAVARKDFGMIHSMIHTSFRSIRND